MDPGAHAVALREFLHHVFASLGREGLKLFKALGEIEEKGGDEKPVDITIKLPYNMDGIIVNIPGYMAGLPQEAWMTEFVATPTEADLQDDAPVEGEDDVLAGAEF